MTTAIDCHAGGLDRTAARRFVDDHVIGAADAWDRDQQIPRAVLEQAAELGVFAAAVPVEHGGRSVSMRTLGDVHEELGRGCSSLRSLATVHTMVVWALGRWGSEDQRRRWLPALAPGETLAAFCLSEPEAGSDTTAIEATAEPRGEGWTINGTKTWITGGLLADLFLVFARTPTDGVLPFLVERGPGVLTAPLPDMLGTRASALARLTLTDVEVGPDALLGPSRFAPGLVMSSALDIGRYSVACGCVGILQACLEASVRYSRTRKVGGSLLSEHQLTQQKIANMVTATTAGRALCERAGVLKDARDEATVMATWVAKYYSSRAAAQAAADAVQLHGAVGCSPAHPVARYYRDAKVMEIIEGSTELQQITIAVSAAREVPA